MRNLKRSAEVVGKVFGLMVGDKFTTPAADELKKHPELLSYAWGV